MNALQLALQSLLRKALRGIAATLLMALLAGLPVIQQFLVDKGLNTPGWEAAIYGFLATGIAALMAAIQRYIQVLNNPKPSA